MKELDSGQYWCPMGRLSIQQSTDSGRIEAIPAGAFNRSILYAQHGTKGEVNYPCRCLGEGCACWKWGFFSDIGLVPLKKRRGTCGLMRSSAGYNIKIWLAGLFIAAVSWLLSYVIIYSLQ